MEYFYGQEAEQYAFFRIPKALFSNPDYAKLSTDAKLLYGLMLDRLELSRHNNWFDGEGRAFIYFKREAIMEQLGVGHNTAAKLIQELEGADLIQRARRGLGMPAMIYVGKFVRGTPGVKKSEKRTNGRPGRGRQEVRNSDVHYMSNKTERNNTEKSILSDPSAPPSPTRPKTRRTDKMGYEKILKENIQYDFLLSKRPEDKEIIDGYIDLMAGICSSHRQWIRIASDEKPRADVRRQLLKLNADHIVYVLDSMAATSTPIQNIRQYTLAALYNAPSSIALYTEHKLNTGEI